MGSVERVYGLLFHSTMFVPFNHILEAGTPGTYPPVGVLCDY